MKISRIALVPASLLALATVLMIAAGVAHAQSTFNKYQPANGVQCNTGSTYVDTACTASQIPAPGSDTQVPYNHTGTPTGNAQFTVGSDLGLIVGGATGGSKGPGTLNATALYINGSAVGTSSGAVSSVALAEGSTTPIFTITGSPVTAAGTLTETLQTQSANTIFAGPTTGAAAQPAFRALVGADISGLSANPSGLIGLTASNGSAATYERSDATHALDQSISPTMTGTWTFSFSTGAPIFTSSTAGNNLINLCNTSNSAGQQCFDERVGSTGSYTLSTATDAQVDGHSVMQVTRTGTAANGVFFSNATDNAPVEVLGNGAFLSGAGGNLGSTSLLWNDIFANFMCVSGCGAWEILGYHGGSTATLAGGTSFTTIAIGANVTATPWCLLTGCSITGNVTMAAPASGNTLGVTAKAAQRGIAILGSSTVGQSLGMFIQAGSNASDSALQINNYNNSATLEQVFGDGSAQIGWNGSASTLTLAAAGNVQIATPVSSTALTVNGLSANDTINVASTGAASVLGIGWAAGISGGAWNLYTSSTDPLTVGTVGAAAFELATNNTNRLNIASGGDVSIAAPSGHPFSVCTSVGCGTVLLQVTGSGSVGMPFLGTSTAAQTGYLCWSSSGGALTVDSTNTCLVSSARYKKNVMPLDLGLDAVMKLRPITYEYKDGFMPDKFNPGRQDGFIAEEVQKVDARLVPLDSEGKPKSVEYAQMSALLVRAIQDQQQEIWELKLALGALAVVSLTWLSALTWKRRRHG